MERSLEAMQAFDGEVDHGFEAYLEQEAADLQAYED